MRRKKSASTCSDNFTAKDKCEQGVRDQDKAGC